MNPADRRGDNAVHLRVVSVRRAHLRTAVVLVLVSALSVFATPAVGAAAAGPAEAAIAWLDAEVAANSGSLPGPGSSEPDWGLTADAALARIAGGRGTEAPTVALAQALSDALADYSTWDGLGSEFAGVRTSGALAKVLLVATSAGLATDDVDGVDLEAELRGLMQGMGPQTGRFSDRNPYGPDNSNGFDQAWAMLALAANGEVPAASVAFLLSQQCPGGGFPLLYDDGGCDSDEDSHPDASALAVQVLLVVERTPEVRQALQDVLGRLLGEQLPDGSFRGAPPTEVSNANSTGLAAQALRGAGQLEAADRAAAWVGSIQVGETHAGTPAVAESGAIAYEPVKFDGALVGGIPGQQRDQWRRATTQGLLALDVGLFVPAADEAPVNPTPTTSTTTTTTTTDTSTTSSTSAVPPTAAPTTAPTTQPSASTSGPDPAVAGAQADGGTADTPLAATGADGGVLGASGAGMVVVGAAAVWLSIRTRRPGREAWHWS